MVDEYTKIVISQHLRTLQGVAQKGLLGVRHCHHGHTPAPLQHFTEEETMMRDSGAHLALRVEKYGKIIQKYFQCGNWPKKKLPLL